MASSNLSASKVAWSLKTCRFLLLSISKKYKILLRSNCYPCRFESKSYSKCITLGKSQINASKKYLHMAFNTWKDNKSHKQIRYQFSASNLININKYLPNITLQIFKANKKTFVRIQLSKMSKTY